MLRLNTIRPKEYAQGGTGSRSRSFTMGACGRFATDSSSEPMRSRPGMFPRPHSRLGLRLCGEPNRAQAMAPHVKMLPSSQTRICGRGNCVPRETMGDLKRCSAQRPRFRCVCSGYRYQRVLASRIASVSSTSRSRPAGCRTWPWPRRGRTGSGRPGSGSCWRGGARRAAAAANGQSPKQKDERARRCKHG